MTKANFSKTHKLRIKSAWKKIDRNKAAKAIGTSKRTIDNWISGTQRVSALTAVHIEKHLGIPASLMRPDIFDKR